MDAGTIWLIVGVVAIAYAIYVYNKLVSLRNHFRNAFSQIDVQLQRRYELIPNLVEVARGYMQHEHETLTEVTVWLMHLPVQKNNSLVRWADLTLLWKPIRI